MRAARARALAAAAGGAASVAGFGDWPLFYVPIVALALLVALWLRAGSAREAAWIGFAYGAGLFLGGVSWVYVSLHEYGMMPAPLAALATVLFCAYLALYPAAVGYAQARIGARPGPRALLLVPGLWTLAEWVRAWFLTGFPWLTLGYSQLDAPLAGLAPVAGVFGMSLAAAFTAGAVALVALRVGPSRSALGLVAVVFAAGFGLERARWTEPVGEPVTVGLLQGNVPQSLKFVPGRYETTLATYAALAEASEARLVVMPETAVPRFIDLVAPAYIERLRAAAVRRGGDLLVGVPLREQPDRYYNAVVSIGTAPRQTYAKSHLVPFGEFIPPGFGWVPAILQIPLSDFARGGPRQRPLAVAGQRVAMNICYEDAFGAEIIRQLPEATLLANVSNVAWFGDSLAPAQHLRISRTRALETGRVMLRATNTGVTAIVDERGRVTARLPAFTEGRLEGRVQGRTGATPYVRAGDTPAVLLSLACAAAAVWAARRRGPAPR
ncbi:MAG: apolipoprotein N-acyltransferase [Burkholderiales bacterium]|nr:apolipoprotein N-acyltransferase [Burkholderiales bacterium]